MTFAGLHLMAMAQPALLYLVPFTLIPVFLLGLKRREWRQLWRGDTQVHHSFETQSSAGKHKQKQKRTKKFSLNQIESIEPQLRNRYVKRHEKVDSALI